MSAILDRAEAIPDVDMARIVDFGNGKVMVREAEWNALMRAHELLPEMIAEIKRLEERCRQEEKHTNKYINYLHKEQLKGEKQRAALKKLGEKVRAKHRAWREEQKWHDIDLGRVKRLEEKYDAMVRSMGRALAEERARRLIAAGAECFFRTPIKGSILSKCDKGIYCDWTTCPIKDEKRQDAREQLRAEGVIG